MTMDLQKLRETITIDVEVKRKEFEIFFEIPEVNEKYQEIINSEQVKQCYQSILEGVKIICGKEHGFLANSILGDKGFHLENEFMVKTKILDTVLEDIIKSPNDKRSLVERVISYMTEKNIMEKLEEVKQETEVSLEEYLNLPFSVL